MSAAGRQNNKRYWVSVKFHIMVLSKSSSTNSTTFYFMFLHNKARHVIPLSIASHNLSLDDTVIFCHAHTHKSQFHTFSCALNTQRPELQKGWMHPHDVIDFNLFIIIMEFLLILYQRQKLSLLVYSYLHSHTERGMLFCFYEMSNMLHSGIVLISGK